MYEYIKGKLALKKIDYAAIDINGVAYKLYISLKTYDKLNDNEAKLYVYTYIKEDIFRLYGFYDEAEREMFSIFLSASGVGPKLSLAILSTYNIEELKDMIVMEDIKRLSKVPGVGPKKGQKIIFEVKDKIKNILRYTDTREIKDNDTYKIEEDVKMALNSLGYNEKDVDKILENEDMSSYQNIETAIREILKKMNK